MKVLIVSNIDPEFHNTNYYRWRAVLSLGHQAVVRDVRAFLFHPRLRQAFPLIEKLELIRIDCGIAAAAERERPDICLVVGGEEISVETLRRIRACGIRCVLWTSDVPHPVLFQNIIQTAPLYDRVFCAGTEAVERLAANGFNTAVWLPFAADPELHCPVKLTPRECETYHRAVSFVGGYYPNRHSVLGSLKEFRPGIWGPNWQKSCNDPAVADLIVSRHIDYSEWVKIYSSADITLVLHYNDGQRPCYQASPKLFEALACGAFVLCDRQRDAMDLFRDGEHLVFFDGDKDLKAKIHYYLSQPLERARIAAAGRSRVLAEHTYKHRLSRLLEGGGA